MSLMRRAGVATVVLLAAWVPETAAQGAGGVAKDAYFGAVAEYFVLPRSEVSILGEWHLPPEEIPVALFFARRAGVSPEAVVALRDSGEGWRALAKRFRLGAAHFHVPLPETASAGPLDDAYRRYRALPAAQWREIELTDAEITTLVNLRLLSETLHRAPETVLAELGHGSWVELYARLIGGGRRD